MSLSFTPADILKDKYVEHIVSADPSFRSANTLADPYTYSMLPVWADINNVALMKTSDTARFHGSVRSPHQLSLSTTASTSATFIERQYLSTRRTPILRNTSMSFWLLNAPYNEASFIEAFPKGGFNLLTTLPDGAVASDYLSTNDYIIGRIGEPLAIARNWELGYIDIDENYPMTPTGFDFDADIHIAVVGVNENTLELITRPTGYFFSKDSDYSYDPDIDDYRLVKATRVF